MCRPKMGSRSTLTPNGGSSVRAAAALSPGLAAAAPFPSWLAPAPDVARDFHDETELGCLLVLA